MRLFHEHWEWPLVTRTLCGLLALLVWKVELLAGEMENPIAQAETLSAAFRCATEGVLPAVVTIKTTIRPHPERGWQWGRNPFGEDASNTFVEARFGEQMTSPFSPGYQGQGSGIIIDSTGLVLTANHVVERADKVVVELPDGEQCVACDIRADPMTDLAVIRIRSDAELPVARLGDSGRVRTGDWVVAIGSPYGLPRSVSVGVISGVGCSIPVNDRAHQLLQTDADIHPGSSGGPLVDLRGRVIGVNTAIATLYPEGEGVGFAIPIDLAKWVSNQLIQSGTVSRAYLGLAMQPLTRDLARQLGLKPSAHGVVIRQVFPRTPAARASARPGDVVTHFAGEEMSTPAQFQRSVERTRVGSQQTLRLLRDGRPMELSVEMDRLAEISSDQQSPSPNTFKHSHYHGSREHQLGLVAEDLTPELAHQFGCHDLSHGVLITEIDLEGPAYIRGLREGMLILKVGKRNVDSIREFRAAVANMTMDDGILLLVRASRHGDYFIVIEPRPSGGGTGG